MSYEDCFDQKTRDLYKQNWIVHLKTEKLIENMRQLLLKNPGFDISKAFKMIDKDNKGYITP